MALILIPSLLSDNIKAVSAEVLEHINRIDEYIVENEKTARGFLKFAGTKIPQSKLSFHLLNEHSTPGEVSALAAVIKSGKDIGLLSEAGCPAVADPGASVVRLAHENGVRVIPLAGPSSILLALMASGFNGQSFTFHGYLPRDGAKRKAAIVSLEKDAAKKGQTQIFMEAPYRNMQLLDDVLKTCRPETRLCIASNLTSKQESVKTLPVSQWRKSVPDINKVPSIFLIGQ